MVVMAITHLQGGVLEWPYLGLALWPTWPIAVVVDLQPEPAPLFSIAIATTISIGLNMIIYSAVGALFWEFTQSS